MVQKVGQQAWTANRAELVGFRLGEWEAELIALGEPTSDAGRSPS
jgi:hypothetical protein